MLAFLLSLVTMVIVPTGCRCRAGIARLRFTRTGDELKIERGNPERWAATMTYRRG